MMWHVSLLTILGYRDFYEIKSCSDMLIFVSYCI